MDVQYICKYEATAIGVEQKIVGNIKSSPLNKGTMFRKHHHQWTNNNVSLIPDKYLMVVVGGVTGSSPLYPIPLSS